MLGFNVFAADTDEEAGLLATSCSRPSSICGAAGRPACNRRSGLSVAAGAGQAEILEQVTACTAFGAGQQKCARASRRSSPEPAPTSYRRIAIFDHRDRLRSYEITAGLWPSGSAAENSRRPAFERTECVHLDLVHAAVANDEAADAGVLAGWHAGWAVADVRIDHRALLVGSLRPINLVACSNRTKSSRALSGREPGIGNAKEPAASPFAKELAQLPPAARLPPREGVGGDNRDELDDGRGLCVGRRTDGRPLVLERDDLGLRRAGLARDRSAAWYVDRLEREGFAVEPAAAACRRRSGRNGRTAVVRASWPMPI